MKTGWERFKELYDALAPDDREWCAGYIGWAIEKERDRGSHPIASLIELNPDAAIAVILKGKRLKP